MNKQPISDNTNLGINLKWLIQLLTASAIAVWGYFQLISRISQAEIDILRLKDDVIMNNQFRVKWPLGELGALPDDAEQNLRLKYMEADIQILKSRVDDLRINSANIKN
tara:strand:+ start:1042 stop:1368 length:327 start_codon:yes stop_codon:yes gene_type:complete